ncbi:MAG: molybdopterin-dependent oxidoreductase [Anaerolineae bacterium]|nr:molybdopterin-dependent oxidoreductase [Anaerolineae bacterium]
MDDFIDINVVVNGKPVAARAEGCTSLMTFLREELGLTGTKNGCASGHCGACSVILDGKLVRSCLVRLSKIKPGARVETIEGLAPDGELHPIQYMFIKHGAMQCGYCTPGMILSAKALLDANPDPGEDEIKNHLTRNRNICRCTGYVNIIKAIRAAAAVMASGETLPPLGPWGKEIQSTQLLDDAIGKVSGKTQYAGDISMPEMLHGKVLWSPYTHARVLSVDASEALAMPGVHAVVTAWDIPGKNCAGVIEVNRDQPAISGREQTARYIGDSIASVFAETEGQAEAALKALKVEYEVLPSVFTPEQAAQPNAPKVHENGNLLHHSRIERGDVDKAFERCAVIIEREYRTERVEHAFMEPEASVAYPSEDGGVTIMFGTQSVFDDRSQIAEMLDVPEEKVRVIQVAQGGSFGGKEDPILHAHIALGAIKTGRPVRIVLTREESLRVHVKRHPAEMWYKTGADESGHVLAIDYKVTLDTGAYMSLGFDVLENMVVFGAGPYYVPNLRLDGKAWYTNNVLSGAMRGFGVNQVAFALEQNMDEMARALGIDPFEFRLINGLEPGLPTASDHVLEPGVPAHKETVRAAQEALKKLKLPEVNGSRRIGVGVASAVKNVGFGHDIPESAGTILEMDKDGFVTLKVTHHEYGQGGQAGQVKLVVNELGIPVERIKVVGPDTAQTVPTGPTTASRQTFLTGNATVMACKALREDLFGRAAEIIDVPPYALEFQEDRIVDPASGAVVALSELGERFVYKQVYHPPHTAAMLPVGEKSHYGECDFTSRMTHWVYAYGTQVAVVEVDIDTGEIKVHTIIAAADVGKLLNPMIFEGQIHGGVVQGLGFALKEEFLVVNGVNLTDSLHKVNLPNANDTPEIIPVLVEVPHPFGPQGVKGFAEAPSLATAAAIANAVYDATGVRIDALPMKKERVLKALQDAGCH